MNSIKIPGLSPIRNRRETEVALSHKRSWVLCVTSNDLTKVHEFFELNLTGDDGVHIIVVGSPEKISKDLEGIRATCYKVDKLENLSALEVNSVPWVLGYLDGNKRFSSQEVPQSLSLDSESPRISLEELKAQLKKQNSKIEAYEQEIYQLKELLTQKDKQIESLKSQKPKKPPEPPLNMKLKQPKNKPPEYNQDDLDFWQVGHQESKKALKLDEIAVAENLWIMSLEEQNRKKGVKPNALTSRKASNFRNSKRVPSIQRSSKNINRAVNKSALR